MGMHLSGCSVCGYCIRVDPWFIVSQTPDLANLIKTARNVYNKKSAAVFDRIVSEAKAKNARDIDDKRECPAIKIIKAL